MVVGCTLNEVGWPMTLALAAASVGTEALAGTAAQMAITRLRTDRERRCMTASGWKRSGMQTKKRLDFQATAGRLGGRSYDTTSLPAARGKCDKNSPEISSESRRGSIKVAVGVGLETGASAHSMGRRAHKEPRFVGEPGF